MYHTCSYCDRIVPTQRHKTVKHKGKTIYFCDESGELNHFHKWQKLRIAKKASLAILNIAQNCNLGICEKNIRDIFRIYKMREIALRIMERIKNNARRILRKATTSIKKLLYHLKTIADTVELEVQYQQLKALLVR